MLVAIVRYLLRVKNFERKAIIGQNANSVCIFTCAGNITSLNNVIREVRVMRTIVLSLSVEFVVNNASGAESQLNKFNSIIDVSNKNFTDSTDNVNSEGKCL